LGILTLGTLHISVGGAYLVTSLCSKQKSTALKIQDVARKQWFDQDSVKQPHREVMRSSLILHPVTLSENFVGDPVKHILDQIEIVKKQVNGPNKVQNKERRTVYAGWLEANIYRVFRGAFDSRQQGYFASSRQLNIEESLEFFMALHHDCFDLLREDDRENTLKYMKHWMWFFMERNFREVPLSTESQFNKLPTTDELIDKAPFLSNGAKAKLKVSPDPFALSERELNELYAWKAFLDKEKFSKKSETLQKFISFDAFETNSSEYQENFKRYKKNIDDQVERYSKELNAYKAKLAIPDDKSGM
jgi:hypothetical protein